MMAEMMVLTLVVLKALMMVGMMAEMMVYC